MVVSLTGATTGGGVGTETGLSATGTGVAVGSSVGAGSSFFAFSFAGLFFAVGFSAGSLAAVNFTARGFLIGAASPSGLAVFFVDEVAMPGEGRGFRSWRL